MSLYGGCATDYCWGISYCYHVQIKCHHSQLPSNTYTKWEVHLKEAVVYEGSNFLGLYQGICTVCDIPEKLQGALHEVLTHCRLQHPCPAFIVNIRVISTCFINLIREKCLAELTQTTTLCEMISEVIF